MNDTCATHRSRVPRRSFGRNKRRSDDIGRRERTRPGFYFMFCVWQSSVRGCRFSVMFVYLVIKMFKCSPVPASFFPYIRTALQAPFHSLLENLTQAVCRSNTSVVCSITASPNWAEQQEWKRSAWLLFSVSLSFCLSPFPKRREGSGRATLNTHRRNKDSLQPQPVHNSFSAYARTKKSCFNLSLEKLLPQHFYYCGATLDTLYCQKVLGHPLLIKGLTTLVISMSTNLYV